MKTIIAFLILCPLLGLSQVPANSKAIAINLSATNNHITTVVGFEITEYFPGKDSLESLFPKIQVIAGIDSATQIYQVRLLDKKGKVIAYRKDGLWMITDCDKSLDIIVGCLIQFTKRN